MAATDGRIMAATAVVIMAAHGARWTLATALAALAALVALMATARVAAAAPNVVVQIGDDAPDAVLERACGR